MSQELKLLQISTTGMVIFLCASSVDNSNYKTLFGVLDNCFLVAYAIGMFFRYAFCFFKRPVSLLWAIKKERLVLTVESLASVSLCATT